LWHSINLKLNSVKTFNVICIIYIVVCCRFVFNIITENKRFNLYVINLHLQFKSYFKLPNWLPIYTPECKTCMTTLNWIYLYYYIFDNGNIIILYFGSYQYQWFKKSRVWGNEKGVHVWFPMQVLLDVDTFRNVEQYVSL